MSDDEAPKKKEWVPFSKRPEWSDVVPTPQDDGPNPVCPIAYSDQFRETMDYFRTILKTNELSPRALDLVTEAIKLNSANYTAWYFRRKVLAALFEKDPATYNYRKELGYVDGMCRGSPKNYQLWYHRRLVVEQLNDPSEEIPFTAEMLEEDAKNYHAWAHRQWVVETYKLWDGELPFVDHLLREDMRNNSAWNQRFFVISKTTGYASKEVMAREIECAFSYIRKAPNNESPWAYLRGLFVSGVKFSEYPQVKDTCLEFSGKYVACPHVVSLLVDIYEQEGTPESKENAAALCVKLATTMDVIRQKYWRYREKNLH